MDYMICYDYRTLDFDTSILEQYRQVNVVAWSMGVWAAPIALASVPKEKLLLIAFNGTITPIGDTDGIPEKTFRDTLSGLTPASLQKFMRRMCKDSNAYKAFLAITPRRDFNEIKEELELIEKKYTQMRGITIDENGNYIYSNDDEMDAYVNDKYQYIDYDYAFIGVNDRIFPLENMKLNFDYMFDDDKLIVADCAHYDEPMFRFLLQDMWSMPIDDFLSHLRDWIHNKRIEKNDRYPYTPHRQRTCSKTLLLLAKHLRPRSQRATASSRKNDAPTDRCPAFRRHTPSATSYTLPPHRRAWLRNGQLLAHVAEHLATGNAVAERPLPGYGGMRQGAMHYAHSPRQLLAG